MTLTELGQMTDEDRAQYPYAVQVTDDNTAQPVVIRFSDKQAAEFYAQFFDDRTLWVALAEPEHTSNPDVPGWRQVTRFYV